ncbi:MAG: XRE family transcriptional regulator [gamma proteobacterium symbiont of Lucinoma myriamae]|nr:XRE family transcriptional regulator [gamma proteobacterium symbiont of Lucinoma myriamae]MCU7818730.1 XRE family transcriptional regulator [gamma proteobacterium symbiont of Lucinoma myriamae]
MSNKFKSVFDAIADTPEEALNMKLRAQLMNKIISKIEKKGWSQTTAAEKLGVTQPRVSDLQRGKMSKFSLDMLVNMLASIGDEVEIRIKEAA